MSHRPFKVLFIAAIIGITATGCTYTPDTPHTITVVHKKHTPRHLMPAGKIIMPVAESWSMTAIDESNEKQFTIDVSQATYDKLEQNMKACYGEGWDSVLVLDLNGPCRQ